MLKPYKDFYIMGERYEIKTMSEYHEIIKKDCIAHRGSCDGRVSYADSFGGGDRC